MQTCFLFKELLLFAKIISGDHVARNKKHPMRHYGSSDDGAGVYAFYKIWHDQKLIIRFVVALIAASVVWYITHGILSAAIGENGKLMDNEVQADYSHVNVENRPEINICTWDLDGSGESKDDISIIATVIQSCDITALQSVKRKQFDRLNKYMGSKYGKSKLMSGMAVVFDKKLVHKTGRVWLGNKHINKKFKINPVTSEYRSGLLKFAITQVNIKGGNQSETVEEVSTLNNLIQYALEKMAPNKKLIIVGDFKFASSSVMLNSLRQKGFENVIANGKSGTQNIWVNHNETEQIRPESAAIINIPDIKINGIKTPRHLPIMIKALVDD